MTIQKQLLEAFDKALMHVKPGYDNGGHGEGPFLQGMSEARRVYQCEIQLLDDRFRKLLAIAEAAEMTAPFCTEPYRGPPIEACGECHACVLAKALVAIK